MLCIYLTVLKIEPQNKLIQNFQKPLKDMIIKSQDESDSEDDDMSGEDGDDDLEERGDGVKCEMKEDAKEESKINNSSIHSQLKSLNISSPVKKRIPK